MRTCLKEARTSEEEDSRRGIGGGEPYEEEQREHGANKTVANK